MHTYFLAPVGYNVGLTTVVLGLVHALEQKGLKVGFVKPISQDPSGKPELTTHFIRQMNHHIAPEPLSMERAEHLLSLGMEDQLMEEIVGLYQAAQDDVDVMIVEGMVPNPRHAFVASLNSTIALNLQAGVILVGAAGEQGSEALTEQFELAVSSFGAHKLMAGYIINHIPAGVDAYHYGCEVLERSLQLQAQPLPYLGGIPHKAEFLHPRTMDIVEVLQARVLHGGEMASRRVRQNLIIARSVPHIVHLLKPGALIMSPGDRDDVMMAVALATLNGIPLAGLLLTSNAEPEPSIAELCQKAFSSDLPVLMTSYNSFESASLLNNMSQHVPADDVQRMEQIIDFIAEKLDITALLAGMALPHELRMTPPAFRFQMVEKARRLNKRIVLPEGNEPRTIQAAVICAQKGIARCVLLGRREEILSVAEAHGVALPDSVEILEQERVRAHYVAPMVELRKHKGLSPAMAEQQLEDNVVLGTMMLQMGDVDGLVSGAVHTTANTIRPALQFIKTAPGAKLVSSVFFMLMPDQVLVYGDCAVNPDPNAEELADIAIQSADSAALFGITPRVAMISYSTGDSGTGDDVVKVRTATQIVRELRPDILIDGPMQYDAASVMSVGKQKAPNSPVAGQATVFIFPDLNTGNTTYKAVQRAANVVSVGPMLQGLRKPVNDLSRGALVDDIVYTIALTAIQAAQMKG
ncbi:MAG: phosphate acetyltransferase [Halothiobacillaceae bacterium]